MWRWDPPPQLIDNLPQFGKFGEAFAILQPSIIFLETNKSCPINVRKYVTVFNRLVVEGASTK
jgi:hypothetical protein